AYRFIRLPIESSLPPIQLPAGAAVDLLLSGWGPNHILFDDQNPSATPKVHDVMITFAPSGTVHLVYHPEGKLFDPLGNPDSKSGATSGVPLTDKIHFLIGKPGRFGGENLIDPDCI
ncbi:MAG: hypothetical protein GTO62_07495, partial [Planctomycetales bacterium]|nr:hypothetical protein [Planctomycetales bacterium]NIP69108.1 hypothetical protein [Planctomycetales bacterium]